MKKSIIIGSVVAVFLMLMIPNVSAVEYQTVKETIESEINNSQEGTSPLNLIDAFKNLLQSIGFLGLSILFIFGFNESLEYDNIGMTLLWLFDIIFSGYLSIFHFKEFVNDLRNPKINF